MQHSQLLGVQQDPSTPSPPDGDLEGARLRQHVYVGEDVLIGLRAQPPSGAAGAAG